MAEGNGGAPAASPATPGSRQDPVSEALFIIEIKGVTIGEFAECTGLQIEMADEKYEEGGENSFVHRFRGRMSYPNLVFTRGVTKEANLLQWFLDCQEKTERKECELSLVAADATKVRTWKFKDAFPVKWQGPKFSSGSNSVATESLEIAHHGFLANA